MKVTPTQLASVLVDAVLMGRPYDDLLEGMTEGRARIVRRVASWQWLHFDKADQLKFVPLHEELGRLSVPRIRTKKARRSLAVQLQALVDDHAYMKPCWHWTPPSNASGRRRYESEHSGQWHVSVDGIVYGVHQSCSCSCRNIRYSLAVWVDDERKDVRAVHKLIRLLTQKP